jgi:signal transduction histidine kinase
MALKTLCKEFSRCGHLRVDYKGIDDVNIPPDTVGISLYRVLQEALTNVAKHAQADSVEVRLERAAGGLYLLIKDNGHGFANSKGATQQRGMGLLSMAERLEALNGRLDIQTAASQGTQLLAFIPQEKWK